MKNSALKMTKWIKAITLIAVAIIMSAFLFACSGSDSSSTSTPQASSNSAPAASGSNSSSTSGPSFEPKAASEAKFDSKSALNLSGAKIDVSNISEGYVGATASSKNRLKFEVAKDGVSMYFDMPANGSAIIAPLTLGNGTYEFNVWENTTDQRYAKLAGTSEKVTLKDEYQPFLRQNIYCEYDSKSEAAKLAKKLVADAENEGDALAAIYDWVVENIEYDKEKAAELSGKSGYIPDPDETISDKSGICFDYSSLVAAMLRSIGIPCKIITGNVAPNDIYHAWNMVYIDGTWVSTYIDVQANSWTRLDSTFSASGADNSFVGDGTNYSERYTY